MIRKVEVSHRTIIFTVFFLLALWLLYQVREIILTLFIGFILMSALNPTVEKMEKIKIPRPLAIFLFYLIFFGGIGIIVAGIIPPLVEQTASLFEKIPSYIEQINFPWLDKAVLLNQFSELSSISENLVEITLNVVENIIAIFILAVITFYLLMERKNLGKYLFILFTGDGRDRAADFMKRIEKRLGSWVRAEFLLMTIIGVMSYLGLRLLGIDFSLPLAVIAGLLEVVPNIGPTIAAVPAVIFGLTISPLYGLAVAALYFFIQQIENTLIVPKVMSKELGINPLVVIISLAVGYKLGGVLGILLAVPIFLVVQEVLMEIGVANNLHQS